MKTRVFGAHLSRQNQNVKCLFPRSFVMKAKTYDDNFAIILFNFKAIYKQPVFHRYRSFRKEEEGTCSKFRTKNADILHGFFNVHNPVGHKRSPTLLVKSRGYSGAPSFVVCPM